MVALVTPFRGGHVDWDALNKLVDFHLAAGTDALVPCGTTGESPTLSHEEHDDVIEAVVKRAGGKVPVIAGTGSNSTEEALRLTLHAKHAGADAALMVSPYYNKPTQEGLYRHFARVADEVDVPIILYNIPSRCGVEIFPATVTRLRKAYPHIVGVKHATGRLDDASELSTLCDIALISGDDSMTLPLMSIGGVGVISVIANIVPKEMKALTDAALAGDFAVAAEQHRKLFTLGKNMLSLETNPIPIKTAMAMKGMIAEEFRLPLCPMAASNRAKLESTLKEAGIL
ncbi:MAG: 4-hydroxy-tetrahydrodipicolinate synthase [Phycisphaerae bacterium]|nr:4-hydroxy-tetrahydrodipicolinate synthase [Phycisphaerae bacterium]